MTRLLAAIAAALLLVAPLREAGAESRTQTFVRAVEEAYAPYRAAHFYLRTGNPFVAVLELESALTVWRDKVMPFAATLPDAFIEDAAFKATLDDIARRLADGHARAADGRAEAAVKVLDPIRPALAELRARNRISTYSDHVDRANAAMDALWEFRRNQPKLSDPAVRNALRRAAAFVEMAYEICRDEAPAAFRDDPEFRRLVDGTLESMAKMWPAIDAKDLTTVINILREVRSFDHILWMRFG